MSVYQHTLRKHAYLIILKILVDLPSPIICAKIQPQDILGSGEEDFKGFYHIWAWQPSCQRTATILAIFSCPNLRRLHMKFEQNWLSSFKSFENVNGR